MTIYILFRDYGYDGIGVAGVVDKLEQAEMWCAGNGENDYFVAELNIIPNDFLCGKRQLESREAMMKRRARGG